jgi:hypothetical protein
MWKSASIELYILQIRVNEEDNMHMHLKAEIVDIPVRPRAKGHRAIHSPNSSTA